MRGSVILIGGVVLVIGLAGIFLIDSGEGSMKGMLIFTQVSAGEPEGGNSPGGAWRYPSQSRIVAVKPEAPEGTLKVLTGGFYAARAPEVSYDGKRLLFAGQRQEGGPWQIWEMSLKSLRTRPVTSGLNGCTDPAYLPDGRVVFSSLGVDRPAEPKGRVAHALYTCALDGSEVKRITFHPRSDFAPTVLQDGRILFVSWPYPSPGASTLLTVRPDGTGIALFYENRPGGRPSSRGWETSDGQVVLVESNESDSRGGRLVALSQKRPLHARVDLASEMGGSFHSASPLPSGELIVSYRPPGAGRYALYEFDPEEKRLGGLISSDPDYHALEPVVAVAHPRPKRLVSIVNERKRTGWLFCLNADLSDRSGTSRMPSPARGQGVRVLGPQGVLGEVPLEEDGSFHIEIPADTPLRLQTVGEDGQGVRGPSAWIWVRPNEHRGCIGCHEDRELAPENRVPLAVTKPPVSLLAPLSPFAVKGSSPSKEIEK